MSGQWCPIAVTVHLHNSAIEILAAFVSQLFSLFLMLFGVVYLSQLCTDWIKVPPHTHTLVALFWTQLHNSCHCLKAAHFLLLLLQFGFANVAMMLLWSGKMLVMTQRWFRERSSRSDTVTFSQREHKLASCFLTALDYHLITTVLKCDIGTCLVLWCQRPTLWIRGLFKCVFLNTGKIITRCGLNPPEFTLELSQWAHNKMTQLFSCHSIIKMFDLLHLRCEWRRDGKSPLANPQSLCSSALTWIYRFVLAFSFRSMTF